MRTRYPAKRLGLLNMEHILVGHLSPPGMAPKYWINPKRIATPHPPINRKDIRLKTFLFLTKFVTRKNIMTPSNILKVEVKI